jgi:hypothetical protein
LSDVQSRAQHGSIVGAVVNDELDTGVGATTRNLLGQCEYFPAPEIFVPELEDFRASREKSFRDF